MFISYFQTLEKRIAMYSLVLFSGYLCIEPDSNDITLLYPYDSPVSMPCSYLHLHIHISGAHICTSREGLKRERQGEKEIHHREEEEEGEKKRKTKLKKKDVLCFV